MPPVSSFTDSIIEIVLATVLGAGIYLVAKHYCKRRWLQRHGLRTLGIVVRLETDSGTADFEAIYYPVVRFHPAGHEYLEVRYDIGSKPASYAIGETVTLLYDPNQPKRFVIGDEALQGWAWLLAIGLFSGILACCLY